MSGLGAVRASRLLSRLGWPFLPKLLVLNAFLPASGGPPQKGKTGRYGYQRKGHRYRHVQGREIALENAVVEKNGNR